MDRKRQNQIKRRKKRPRRTIFFLGLFLCLLGGAAAIAIFLPFFEVKGITVQGTEDAVMAEIEQLVRQELGGKFWRVIPEKSILVARTDKISQRITDSYPTVESVSVSRVWPDILSVRVKEREQTAIWCRIEKSGVPIGTTTPDIAPERKTRECFCLDAQGVLFRESPLIKGITLNIYSSRVARIRDVAVDPRLTGFILGAQKGAREIQTVDKNVFLEANEFEIISNEDVRADLASGGQIYFNPSLALEQQLEALRLTIQNEVKENYRLVKYIDLRIEGRVYYK